MMRLLVFLVLSLPVVWVSRRSLLHPTSHGFPRFFAFEAVLALLVLNVPDWFREPFRMSQLVSWVLLCASAALVVWGFACLRRLGGFRPAAEMAPEYGWERTGQLVTSGIYRYIRHPMYGSVLLLAWGALLKSVTIGTLALGAIASVAVMVTAKTEEAENVKRFGADYVAYMKRTRRFVPFLL